MSNAHAAPWTFSTIGEDLYLINGFGFKPHQWKECGVPIIRIQNLNDHEAPFDYVQHNVDERFLVKTGDLLFAWSGSRGTSFGPFIWNRGDAVLNQHIFNVRFKKSSLDKTFCYWWLKFLVGEIEQQAHGSAGLVHITRKELEKFRFPELRRNEQRKIARILTTLDHLIEKTEALIAKYQAIKQGMMHDLFTRGVDEHGQLRPLQSEAPELYKQSELGWIPREWSSPSVGSVLLQRPTNGYSPKESDEWTGTLMLGLGCLTPTGFVPLQLKNAPKDDPYVSPALLKDGDILISRSNTRELVALVGTYRDIGIPCIYPDLMMRLVPTNDVLPEYLEAVLRHSPVRRQLTNASCGTSGSMMKINAEMVVSTVLPLPRRHEQQRILDRLAAAGHFITESRQERDKLQSLKSGLMQDLLTGKVRVKADRTEECSALA